MPILNAFFSFMDGLNRLVKTVLAILIAMMSLIVIAQVICRLAKIQLSWSEELSRYLMIYIAFIGTGYMVRFDLMMSVTFVRDRLPPIGRRIISIASNTIMLCFFVVILVYAAVMMERVQGQLTPAMQISMSLPYAGIVVGSTLMAVNAITVILERIVGKEKPK